MLPQCTRSPGDWGMRALCLFSGEGAPPGSTAAAPASLTDVAPTICSALGIAPPLQADGSGIPEVLDAGRKLTGIQVTERDDGDRDREAR